VNAPLDSVLTTDESRFSCQEIPPARTPRTLEDDVREGLLTPPRSLQPKYFYDDLGSRLFDRICDTPEYYPTRTEAALLADSADAIMRQTAPDHIIELGSGASRKTRHLLDACAARGQYCRYWPFDVCEPMLRTAGEGLVTDYDWLEVRALVGDYMAGLAHLPQPEGRRLFVFLGGTLGNFDPQQAQAFLTELRRCMRDGDSLLVGVDRVKDTEVLNAAYNDSQGLTAAFNLNLLNVLNRELAADFDPGRFEHTAAFNEQDSQIEMYLISTERQAVELGALDETLSLEAGEEILTEISRKFTPEGLTDLFGAADLRVTDHLEPPNRYFSLLLLEAA
jgi:L-histidine N-alpha-methyltransferase